METTAQAVAEADASKLRLAAHTLRGSLRYFGDLPAIGHLHQLETMGQDRNLTDAAVTLATVQAEVGQLTPAMEEYLSAPQA
jgi:HPt (histidine-containing phosphotransfer) domain-containing protein